MIDALLYAVRDKLRAAGISLGVAECEIMDDGKPPPRAGSAFAAVHDGVARSTNDNTLYELYDFSVTLTMRLGSVTIDRVGDQLIARNLARDPLGNRQGFNAKVEQLRGILHMNWAITVLTGQTPASANDNLSNWSTGTVYGFCEPARYRGYDRVQLVGSEWFAAEVESEGEGVVEEFGIKSRLRFEGAKRFQQLTTGGTPTGLTATAQGSSIQLSWGVVSGASYYTVYRSTTSGSETLLATGISDTSYVDSAVVSGTTYYYQVTASGNEGESSKSNEVSKLFNPTPILFLLGNSHARGLNANTGVVPSGVLTTLDGVGDAFPQRLVARLRANPDSPTFTAYCYAVDGYMMADVLTVFSSAVGPSLTSSTANIVLLVGPPSGDFRNNHDNAYVLDKINTLGNTIHALSVASPKLLVGTHTDNLKSDNQAFFDTNFTAFADDATGLRSLLGASVDGIIKLYGDTRIAFANAHAGSYFSGSGGNDGIHLGPTGQNLRAWYESVLVQRVLAPKYPFTQFGTRLKAWLKSGWGLSKDSAVANIASAEGDAVGSWQDQSCTVRLDDGSMIHVPQSTAGKLPLLRLGARNGKSGVDFDGSDDYLISGLFFNSVLSQPFTVYLVFKQSVIGTIGVNDFIWTGNGSNFPALRQDTTPETVMTANGAIVYNGNVCNNAYGSVVMQFANGGTSTLRFNGVQVASGVTSTQQIYEIVLGATIDGIRNTDITVLEYGIIDGLLSVGEQAGLESYLSTEYAL